MNHESIVLAVKNKILIYSAKNLRKTLFTKDLSLSPLFYLENLKNCRQENPLALNLALLFSLLSKVRLFWEGQKFDEISQWICVWLMCGSCHINRATNAKFSVEFWMFVLIFFQLTSDLKEVQFTQNYLVWLKAPLKVPQISKLGCDYKTKQ